MKAKELLVKAELELKTEQEKEVLALIKTNLKRITSAKKILAVLEKAHQKLLETDIENIELEFDDSDY